MVTRLGTGEGEVDGQDVQIQILPVTPETGLDRVGTLLERAGVTGWAAGKISNSLYVEALDMRQLPDGDVYKNALHRIREQVIGEWERRGDFWIDMSTLDTIAFSPGT